MNKERDKVRDWPIVGARVDPKQKEAFERKLAERGETQNHALRRMIRQYGND